MGVGWLCLGTVLAATAIALDLRPRRASRIVRISRVVTDLARAEAFYRDGLGFRRVGGGPVDPALLTLFNLPGSTAEEVVMRLGDQEVALVRMSPPGPAYPTDSRSDDLWFQHLAIVVDDMDAAYEILSAQQPQPISKDGPQRLPKRDGRVVAFKFRDPDGHPLELIHFPPGEGRAMWQRKARSGPFLGIDHSALAISGTKRSRRFYERLGFTVASRSLNHGKAQNRLDGLRRAVARITGLQLGQTVPGLELLRYEPSGRSAPPVLPDTGFTDWVTLLVPGLRGGIRLGDGRRASVLRDPDGHLLLLVNRALAFKAVARRPPAGR